MVNEKNGSRRIPEEKKDRAIVMRRDEKALLREIVEETGISVARLKEIFKAEGIRIPYRRKRGTPRPNARTARLGKKGNNGNNGKSMAQRAVVRDPKKPKKPKPPKRKQGDYSPLVAMDIERRMQRRREAAASAPVD